MHTMGASKSLQIFISDGFKAKALAGDTRDSITTRLETKTWKRNVKSTKEFPGVTNASAHTVTFNERWIVSNPIVLQH